MTGVRGLELIARLIVNLISKLQLGCGQAAPPAPFARAPHGPHADASLNLRILDHRVHFIAARPAMQQRASS